MGLFMTNENNTNRQKLYAQDAEVGMFDYVHYQIPWTFN